ncbi:transporter substrate-binding domain-containing protein [Pseudodesulfovibrio sp. zrk46]|uniref:transglycosylase SLT domain-containing protein n=1 Tax=Pseudodesulfovibrio sp. zrk46 TaxID=2725288 RepID=UPI001449D009|nr:transporter substrate-binding domain-containing protein [Pseudodesulfovibrio sp. zrk46]QJB55799.1 transporter substrate-binding domain-containing protein [Pseudodesulfovibrio sp. zrk46]
MFVRFVVLCLFLILTALPAAAAPDSLTRMTDPWKGDLTQIIKEHRPIRVLVSYNRTNFFLVRGAMRGMEYDLMQAYKKHLAATNKTMHPRMVFVTVPFDELIPALLDGRGDIAAAGLTATAARKRDAAFTSPYRTNVDEIVVGSYRAAPIHKLEDLAGKTVHVMAGSSYATHLRTLNHQFKRRGIKPIDVVEPDPHLVTEDLLEMAERGIINYTVADSHLAEIWKSALPRLKLFKDIPLHSGGDLAWAVRPGSKALLKSLSEFANTVQQGTLMGNMVFKRYFVNSDWVKDPNAREDKERLQELRSLFEKYGEMYRFDWLKLAAQAYQESRFNMDTKSAAGAVGIMQVRPATALDPNVNVKDYKTLEGNIHAGAKYLRFLRDNYFQDVAPEARVDFALAAYNAGPARVIKLRKAAREMGLNPDLWFANVEWAAYKDIGTETPSYVANVQMYYAAYKSIAKTLTVRGKVK